MSAADRQRLVRGRFPLTGRFQALWAAEGLPPGLQLAMLWGYSRASLPAQPTALPLHPSL